jgi:hypothetical protein
LAERKGVSFSYNSKVNNKRLHFGDCPNAKFVQKQAWDSTRMRTNCCCFQIVFRHHRRNGFGNVDAFQRFADLDDAPMDELLSALGVSKKSL